MSGVVGTIVRVGDYLKPMPVSINVGCLNDTKVFELEKDRIYIIPDYQREIRWEKEQLIELMMDLKSGDKFLGNIILSKRDNQYYIIDGQQRSTVILMLITYIRSKFGKQLDIIETCKIKNDNFGGLEELFEHNFDTSEINMDSLLETDYYKQYDQYIQLWDGIKKTDIINNSHNAETFYKNVIRSEINIIINTEDGSGTSIDYFLDTNLKGVKLDSEDIFKCYLFSKDSSEEIRKSWINLKKYSFELQKENNKYTLMNILYQYFICDLYKHNIKFRDFTFKDDFSLSEFKDSSSYYKGEHLIKVINHKNYMKKSLDIVNEYLKIVYDIACSDGQTALFKENFKVLDDQERKVIFKLIKNMVKDLNLIPKVALMKYIIESIILGKKTKEECRKVYTVYFFTTFFNAFSNKKDRNLVYNLMKDNNWSENLVDQIRKYLKTTSLTKTNASLQYKYTNEDSGLDERFRCKALASLYNYFEIKKDEIRVKNTKQLYDFLNNDSAFSIEHFIISDNKKGIIKVDGLSGGEYSIPKKYRKYKNSLFNFIFIDTDTNTKLENYNIVKKISILQKDDIKCEYSKMVFDVLTKFIQEDKEIISLRSNLSEDALDEFFEDKFLKLYVKYINKIFEQVIEKFKR